MPKTSHHISKESFLLACKICEQGNPSIAHDEVIYPVIENLIKLDAFIIGKNSWIEGENGEYLDVIYQGKNVGYIDKKSGQFITISFDKIYKYQLKVEWLIKTILQEIDMNYNVINMVDNMALLI